MRPSPLFALSFVACAATGAPPMAAPADPGLTYDQACLAAQSYLDSNRVVDALATATDATHADPNRPEAYVVIGRAHGLAGDLTLSIAAYEAARRLHGADPTLYAELAAAYDVAKRYIDAAMVYHEWLEAHPDDAAMRAELGLTFILANQIDAAIEALAQAHRLAPGNVQILQDLGYAYLRARRYGEARPFLSAAHAQGRTEAGAFLARAALGDAGRLIDAGDLQEAQAAVDQARNLLHDHPRVRFRQAQIDWRHGRRPALRALLSLTETEVEHEAWTELAQAARILNDPALAHRAEAAATTRRGQP